MAQAAMALAAPKVFESLDFSAFCDEASTQDALVQVRLLEFLFERPGSFGGFAVFITAEMTAEAVTQADRDDADRDDGADETQRADRQRTFYERDAPPRGVGFSSAWPGASWAHPFLQIDPAWTPGGIIQVEPGDKVLVQAAVDLTTIKPRYAFRAYLRHSAGADETHEDRLVLDTEFE